MSQYHKDLIGAFSMLAFVVIGFYMTTRIDLSFSSDLETFTGPRGYPRILLGGMLVIILVLFAMLLVEKLSFADSPEMGEASDPGNYLGVVQLVVFLAICFVFLERVGYILTMPVLITLAARLHGSKRWLPAIATGLVACFICLVVFRYGLNTVLPEGLLGIDQIF